MAVGTIRFDWYGTEVQAALGDDLAWTVTPANVGGEDLQGLLNQFYGPEEGDAGTPGSAQLFGTAQALKGSATLEEKPQTEPENAKF